MKVVIMAGGLGTRLRPLTFSIPKPLLPVGEKPILEVILSKLKDQGFTDIILAVGYKSELIKSYFQDGKKFGVNIKYFEEKEKLGTAGPLRQIKDEFNISEPILVMNGDILTQLDFNKIIGFHKENNADFTVGTRQHVSKSPFGVIKIEGNRILDIKEKPEIKLNVSAGIYVMSPSLIDLIPKNSFYQIPELILDALKQGKNILSYDIKEYWLAIEYLKHFDEAQKEEANWKDNSDSYHP